MAIIMCERKAENMKPEMFFRPLSSSTWGDLIDLNKRLARDLSSTGWPIFRNKLRVGAEFEVLFFSEEMSPSEASKLPNSENPNYQTKHNRAIEEARERAGLIGNKKPFGECSKMGKLGIEFRTSPLCLNGYEDTVETLREHVVRECQELGMLPLVYSQHIHLSMIGLDGHNKLGANSIDFSAGVKGAFNKVLPLVLLPYEYVGLKESSPYKMNGTDLNDGPVRPEFRKLSSEYACDPILNLSICLWACLCGLKKREIFTEGTVCRSYELAAINMERDTDLELVFGSETTFKLATTALQYLKVAEGQITIQDIKNKKDQKQDFGKK